MDHSKEFIELPAWKPWAGFACGAISLLVAISRLLASPTTSIVGWCSLPFGFAALAMYAWLQREEAAYFRLLKRPDVKEALFNLEDAQLRRDSVSHKLCGGSSAVSVGDLSRLETDLCAAKANLKVLADQLPILQNHPKVQALLAGQL